jgi:hypothetical protein
MICTMVPPAGSLLVSLPSFGLSVAQLLELPTLLVGYAELGIR